MSTRIACMTEIGTHYQPLVLERKFEGKRPRKKPKFVLKFILKNRL
jgi:hypothetical protein